jgi:tripartite-type tricarboxylate transporter receptor subunit TctC
MLTRRAIMCSLAAAGVVLMAGEAVAQGYPNRTIKIVVPFPPGGPTDVTARLVADRLQARFGQSVIVESRPGGAGGMVGAKSVAASEPDGYTLLFGLIGTLTITPAIYKNSGYDPVKNFAPVAKVGTNTVLLATHPSLPVKSLAELIAYAKANPGKVSYGSPGFGTQPHLVGELFKHLTGVNIVHIPYKGLAPTVTDLLAGQVQMTWAAPGSLVPHVRDGKLRGLAVTDEERMKELPDVPTTAEGGLPQLRAETWSGLVAPAGTPPDVIAKLNTAINAELKTDAMRAAMAKFSTVPAPMTAEAFSAFFAGEVKKYADLVTAVGITPR